MTDGAVSAVGPTDITEMLIELYLPSTLTTHVVLRMRHV
jgi:hypothetical protein